MRCTLLHRRRGSVHGRRGHGLAAAPWPEKLRRGQWRPGRRTGWGQEPRRRPGRTPRGSCSERRRPEGTSVGDAKMSHCGNAPEMKKPPAEPKKRNDTRYTCNCIDASRRRQKITCTLGPFLLFRLETLYIQSLDYVCYGCIIPSN